MDNPRFLFILSLAIADFGLCLLHSIVATINTTSETFAVGIEGCIATILIDDGFSVATNLSLVAITLERYLAIIHRINLTYNQTVKILFGLWLFSLFFGLYPYLVDAMDILVVLGYAKLNCEFKWYSKEPLSLPISIIAVVLLFSVPAILFYAYYRIIQMYFSKRKAGKKINTKERLLLVKSIIICGTQLLFWTPYFVSILYETVTHLQLEWMDGFANVCALMNCCANCLILYLFDFNIQGNIRELFDIGRLSSLSRNTDPNPQTQRQESIIRE
ncbi:hypothetical protein HDV01_006051 [Terramyces sp. JEL0728]|nr:hypothetical protein HDV01_006051 [Terramyces sp. JEL0728]